VHTQLDLFFFEPGRRTAQNMEDPVIRRGRHSSDEWRWIRSHGIAGWSLALLREAILMPGSLWRVPTSGGVPAKVLDGVILGNYAVLDKGIYYIDRPSGQGGIYLIDRPSGETRLQYFDFATRRSKTIAHDLGNVDLPLAPSADGRTILYSRVDSSVDELMLVENFR
jgi:hypothetical protein